MNSDYESQTVCPQDGANLSAMTKAKNAMRRPSGQFYERVVVVWMTLSVASVVLAAATWARLSRQLNAATQAVAVRMEVNSIFQLLLEAQSSQRGYALTGDQRFLNSLESCATSLPRRFESMESLAQHDPALLKGIMDFRGRAEASLDDQRRVVLARQKQGPASAAALVAGGEGEGQLAALRRDVAALGATSSALVFDQGAGTRDQLTRAILTSLVAGILGLGTGLLALALSRLTIQHQERERELIEAKLQADRRSQEKTVFLANMSHEIRTPMNAILGFGELLENDPLNAKQRDYLHSIRRSASSLLQLINDMLDMSKIEAGVLELRPEPTDPCEICQFIQTMFSEHAARKHVEFSWKMAEGLPRSLVLDRVRLRQILVNLVGNSVKFTDQGGIELRVRWEAQAPGKLLTLLIEVEDTGVGIPSDRLEAIFNPFVQAGAHPEKDRQGTGLGLSIVKRLTEMMGGSVAVTSGLEQGSLFRLRFPDVAISDSLPAEDQLLGAAAANFNGLRPATVLGVDDNETNRHLLQAMLGDSHHRLVLAGGGPEAIELAREVHPDVILLDIRMPGMHGHQVLEALREIPALKSIPVVAITASSLVTVEIDGRPRFDGYMSKPYSRQNLFDELARFLPRLPQTGVSSDRLQLPDPDRSEDDWEDAAVTQELRHDLKSSLAGVVMSGELLFEQIALLNDAASTHLLTKIITPSRHLLQIMKAPRARASSFADVPPPGNHSLSPLADECKAHVGDMQADAQELCRRMGRLMQARSVQLSENILRSCTDMANLAQKFAAHHVAAKKMARPVCLGLREPVIRQPLSLLTPCLPNHGLPGH
jgi:signal transduction histidine kinase/DNA-binding response OmpR family regulator